MTVQPSDYQNNFENQWCPGCGNFGILEAMKRTLLELDLPPKQVIMCSGIGQAPKLPHYLRINTFNGLHGREVAAATGAKLSAPDLVVLVHAGEGGAYGEGGNHLLHAIRRNNDLSLIVHDNKVYGLTKGQASPTSPIGTTHKIQPQGVFSLPLNPLALAISQNCSFVGQGFSGALDPLVALLKQAIKHRGFSLINVLQPCVTWDKVFTFGYYRKHCYELGAEHNPKDQMQALRLTLNESEQIPLGVIYQNDRPVYEQQFAEQQKTPMREAPAENLALSSLIASFY